MEIEPTKIIFETQSEYNNKGPSKSRQPAKFDAYVKRIDQNSLPTFSEINNLIELKSNFHWPSTLKFLPSALKTY